ncbi:MAG: hypothetical protein ACLGG5_01080 [Thermoleophilia bacterium]
MRTVIAVLIVIALGVGIGRLSAPHSSLPSPQADPHPGPARTRSGVGVGFPRSRAGAVLAAGSYAQALADKAVLSPAVLKRRIEAIATPAFVPMMLEANRPGAERLRRGPFGAALRAGEPSVFFGTPIAYRLLSYSPGRAVLRVWGFTLIGSAAGIEPSASFGLSRTVLVWRQRQWMIASTRASFGPTPRLISPRTGGEGFDLIELSKELRPYGLAP